MKATVTVVTLFLLAATGVQASEVYKTTDAQGRPIYTDKPPTLPAQKLDIRSSAPAPGDAQQPSGAEPQRDTPTRPASTASAATAADARRPAELTAEDRARRCQEARQRYQAYYSAPRLYEPGEKEGERRYLSAEEIDAARADAKQLMDEFCGSP